MDTNHINEQLKSVSEKLNASSKLGLEVEVILSSLIAMKENSNLSIDEALQIGFSEWVK